jgi:hypothetical protein
MDKKDLGISMPVKLHPVNRPKGQNSYCGPAAVSVVTGAPTSEVARVMRRGRFGWSHVPVKSTYDSDLRYALQAYGLDLKMVEDFSTRPTLARWLRENKSLRTPGVTFIISAGNHWVVISGRRYCCGIVGEITSVRDSRIKRRSRVSVAYQVVRKGKISLSKEYRETSQQKEAKKSRRKMYREWSKLKKQQDAFDFSVVDEGETWHFGWIEPGASWDFDPHYEEHFCDELEDAISMANCYIKEFPNRKTGKWSFEENRE